RVAFDDGDHGGNEIVAPFELDVDVGPGVVAQLAETREPVEGPDHPADGGRADKQDPRHARQYRLLKRAARVSLPRAASCGASARACADSCPVRGAARCGPPVAGQRRSLPAGPPTTHRSRPSSRPGPGGTRDSPPPRPAA